MDSEPVVIDISSDEEACDAQRSSDASFSWSSELSEYGGSGAMHRGISVARASEISSTRDSASSKIQKVESPDGLDDDCIILESKPDDQVASAGDSYWGDESDEVLIVQEKGELACRDYPHPRHLCATFPFSTTPHQKHCLMCHCYVCDSPAPCVYWNVGSSSIGHCHATNKEKIWSAERESFKARIRMAQGLHHDDIWSKNTPTSSSGSGGRSSIIHCYSTNRGKSWIDGRASFKTRIGVIPNLHHHSPVRSLSSGGPLSNGYCHDANKERSWSAERISFKTRMRMVPDWHRDAYRSTNVPASSSGSGGPSSLGHCRVTNEERQIGRRTSPETRINSSSSQSLKEKYEEVSFAISPGRRTPRRATQPAEKKAELQPPLDVQGVQEAEHGGSSWTSFNIQGHPRCKRSRPYRVNPLRIRRDRS